MKNTNYLKIAAAGTAAFMISAATGGFRIHISECYPRGLGIRECYLRGLWIHSICGQSGRCGGDLIPEHGERRSARYDRYVYGERS